MKQQITRIKEKNMKKKYKAIGLIVIFFTCIAISITLMCRSLNENSLYLKNVQPFFWHFFMTALTSQILYIITKYDKSENNVKKCNGIYGDGILVICFLGAIALICKLCTSSINAMDMIALLTAMLPIIPWTIYHIDIKK